MVRRSSAPAVADAPPAFAPPPAAKATARPRFDFAAARRPAQPKADDRPEENGSVERVPELLARIPQVGSLDWIGVSPGYRRPIEERREVRIRVGFGLDGDHHSRRGTGKRQVTLIQAEHLAAIEAMLLPGVDGLPQRVTPDRLRRNLLVRGFPLVAVKDRRFRVGDVLLEGTGLCHPCSRMEEYFGPGGYNAVRGHGGITARVLEGGVIRVGDPVRAV